MYCALHIHIHIHTHILIAQGAASSGLNELIVAISRSQDPYNLSEKLIPHLEVLLKIDINIDKSESTTAICRSRKKAFVAGKFEPAWRYPDGFFHVHCLNHLVMTTAYVC